MTKLFKLPKYFKLCKNNKFQALYRTGKSYANRLLVMYISAAEDSSKGKIGFAAGKRLGNAVVRNRLKRLLREAYRLQQVNLLKNVDMILVARKPLVPLKRQDAEKALLDLWRKAKMIK